MMPKKYHPSESFERVTKYVDLTLRLKSCGKSECEKLLVDDGVDYYAIGWTRLEETVPLMFVVIDCRLLRDLPGVVGMGRMGQTGEFIGLDLCDPRFRSCMYYEEGLDYWCSRRGKAA
jgi:hypothetical protein